MTEDVPLSGQVDRGVRIGATIVAPATVLGTATRTGTLPAQLPAITSRAGLDLSSLDVLDILDILDILDVLDVTNDDDVRWLSCLVWPR